MISDRLVVANALACHAKAYATAGFRWVEREAFAAAIGVWLPNHMPSVRSPYSGNEMHRSLLRTQIATAREEPFAIAF